LVQVDKIIFKKEKTMKAKIELEQTYDIVIYVWKNNDDYYIDWLRDLIFIFPDGDEIIIKQKDFFQWILSIKKGEDYESKDRIRKE